MDHQEEHSESSESDTEYLVNVVKQVSTLEQSKKSHSGPIYVEMIIVDTKQPVKLQVDCGAEINVISRKRVNNVDHQEEHSESSESDTEYLVNVVKQVSTLEQSKKSHSGPIYVEMIIVDTKQPVKLQVDCGAEINVISRR